MIGFLLLAWFIGCAAGVFGYWLGHAFGEGKGYSAGWIDATQDELRR